MVVLATRDSWWMTQCEAALLAEGVPLRWISTATGAALLDVPTSDAGRTAEILSSLLGEEITRRAQSSGRLASTAPLLLQPAFAVGVGLALLTVVFFWVTGPLEAQAPWFVRGAFIVRRVLDGEWWRFVTAATLHADASHAVGNAGFFLILGWAAAERLGAGVTTLVWLATAMVGFVAGLLFSDASVTVGASGGLFGLLGAAAAHALRHRNPSQSTRRDRLRIAGGAMMLLAFTAFSPRANIAAHLGGFVAGVAVGAALPDVRRLGLLQVCAAAAAAGAVGLAWAIA